ncbi:hypothetical protein CASFOL_013935 [Castilleja foliolosa]|uniref:CCHC-type domain-containing protein n=1 Tax=Castilleja foliolosa TaxID=1961234 RepID=A0ABD3DQH1_9LAMI
METNHEVNALADILDNQCIQSIELSPSNPDKENSLIAKILSSKPINMNVFKTTIIKAWNPAQRVDTNLLEENSMVFIFQAKKDMEKVLNLSWTFRDFQIITVKWPIEKSLKEIDLNHTGFWIRAFGIPVAYINQSTAKVIGNTIGKYLKADLDSPTQKWKNYVRIHTEIDIQKPLVSHIVLSCSGKSKIAVEIRYERLTDCCYKCGKLGHKMAACKEIENSGSKNYLGPWLKAENSLLKNPISSQNLNKTDEYPISKGESSRNYSITTGEGDRSNLTVETSPRSRLLDQINNSSDSLSGDPAPPATDTSDGMVSESYPTNPATPSDNWSPNKNLKPTNLFPDNPQPNKEKSPAIGPITQRNINQSQAHGLRK